MKPQDAYVMLDYLQNVMQEGTGVRIHRKPYGEIPWSAQIGGKTGTTQQHSDGWYMGVTPNLVTGVWVGADDPVVAFRTIDKGQGANMALPIFGKFLRKVYDDGELGVLPTDEFEEPDALNIELDCTKYAEEEAEQDPDPYDDLY